MAVFQALPAFRPATHEVLRPAIPDPASSADSLDRDVGLSGPGTGTALQVVVDWTAHHNSAIDDALQHRPVLAALLAELTLGVLLVVLYFLRRARPWAT